MTRGAASRSTAATRSAATNTVVRPTFSGAVGAEAGFLYHNHLTATTVPLVLDEFREMGLTTVIVTATRYKTTDCATNAYGWWALMPDLLGTILTAAAARGMGCYVGLVESSNVCVSFHTDPNKTQDVAEYTSTVTTLLASYGTSPALKGWYIIDEQALPYEQVAATLTAQEGYFLAVRDAIRALSALPIIVAPYLGNVDGQGTQTPAQVATKVQTFRANTGGDLIINMQDSTGADGISVGWDRSGDRAHVTQEYYDAMVALCGAAAIWSDNEVFTYPSASFVGGRYRPGPMTRIRRQLLMAQSCGMRSLWLPTTHMTPSNTNASVEAANLKARYLASAGIRGEWVTPASYTWTTARLIADRGNALFDGWTGDPRNVGDPAYVGFATGNVVVTVDMGGTKTLNWLALHTTENAASGYGHPTSILIETSPDNTTWTGQGTTTPALAAADGEYMLGNTTKLSVPCRYVRVTTANASAKTLMSEMEIVANV